MTRFVDFTLVAGLALAIAFFLVLGASIVLSWIFKI